MAISLFTAACEKEVENISTDNNGGIYTAVMEQTEGDTRSAVTDEGIFSWVNGDPISVIAKNNDTYTVENMTLSVADAAEEGTFTVTGTDPTYATYPQIAKDFDTDGKLTSVTLPDTYNSYNGSTNAAMFAKFETVTGTDTGNVVFKHLGAVLRIRFSALPAGYDQFVFTATGKKITGDFTVNVNDEHPEITTADDNTGENTTITFNFTKTTENQAKTFYIPLPAGHYSEFIVELKNTTTLQKYTRKATKGYTIARKQLALLPEISGGVPTASSLQYSIDGGTTWKDYPSQIGETFATATELKLKTVGDVANFNPEMLNKLMAAQGPNITTLDMSELLYLDIDNNANGVVAFPSNAGHSFNDNSWNPLYVNSSETMDGIQKLMLPKNATKLFILAEDNSVELNDKKNRSPFNGHDKLKVVKFGPKLVELDCAQIEVGKETNIASALPDISQIKKIGFRAFDSSSFTGTGEFSECTEFGEHSFYRANFTTITFASDYNVKICRSAFLLMRYKDTEKLVTFNNWNSVTEIGDNAFNSSTIAFSEDSRTLDLSNVTSIGSMSFYRTNIEKVIIGNKLTDIPSGAFQEISSLKEIVFPDSRSELIIQARAFQGPAKATTGLESLTVPSYVRMHPTAFVSNPRLHTLTLESNVTDLDGNAFTRDDRGALFNSDKTVLYMYPCTASGAAAAETEYTIPNTVKTIGFMAFRGNSTLRKIIVPDSVETLGTEDGVGSNFSWMTALEEIDMSASKISALKMEAFKSTETLKIVKLPETLSSIEDQAFKYTGSLDEIYCASKNAPTIYVDPFNKSNSTSAGSKTGQKAENRKVYIPSGSMEAYQSSDMYTVLTTDLDFKYTFIEQE